MESFFIFLLWLANKLTRVLLSMFAPIAITFGANLVLSLANFSCTA